VRAQASVAAYTGALGGILYAVAFVLLEHDVAAAILLMLGGLASTIILFHLGTTLFSVNEPVARWALVIGTIASTLTVVHAGYDLAKRIHPPGTPGVLLGHPSAVDPRGLATFGIAGLAYLTLATLMSRSDAYAKRLARLGQALGVIMIVIYLGRLIILDPENIVVRIALAAGVAANTAFLLWLGRTWSKAGEGGTDRKSASPGTG
jgi:hypothetical protein